LRAVVSSFLWLEHINYGIKALTRRQTFVPIVHRFEEVLPIQWVHFGTIFLVERRRINPDFPRGRNLNLLTSVYWTVVLHDDLVQSLGFLGFLLHHLDVRFAIITPDNQTVNKTD